MPEDTHGIDEADMRLLEALRSVASRVDPPPPAVAAAARESFTWRTIDAELADLAYDSVLDDARLAGVRSADAPRTLTFDGPEATIELEVTELGSRRRLLGQLVPPRAAEIQVRHADGVLTVEADEIGRFTVDDVTPGPVSLLCRLAGGDQPPVETAWVVL